MTSNDKLSGWQPIETAPLEKVVLLFCQKINSWDRPAGMEGNIIVGIKRGRPESASWVSDVVEGESDYYGGTNIVPFPIIPLYWMSLPEEPSNG